MSRSFAIFARIPIEDLRRHLYNLKKKEQVTGCYRIKAPGALNLFWWVCVARVSKSRVLRSGVSLKNEGFGEQKFKNFAS